MHDLTRTLAEMAEESILLSAAMVILGQTDCFQIEKDKVDKEQEEAIGKV